MNDFQFQTITTTDVFDGFFKVPIIIFGIFFLVVVAIIVITVIIFVRKKSKFGSMVDKTFEVAENHLNNVLQSQKEKNQAHVCDYCGTLIPAGKNECSSCGAKIKTKKSE